MLESLLVSTGVIALAEIGDKTQLLAFLLAARFKKPLPIIAGIFVATTLNHSLAGALGAWLTTAIGPDVLRWVLGVSFIGMAIWTLIPDEIEEDEAKVAGRLGVFGATAVTFFLAEMGDKTQLATVAMAAHYATPLMVVIGTTLGMLIADVPAVSNVASQHSPFPDWSCTRAGNPSGSGRSGNPGSAWRFGPLPLSWTLDFPVMPAFSLILSMPSGSRSLSLYENPLMLCCFQQGFVPHVPSAGAMILYESDGSKTQSA